MSLFGSSYKNRLGVDIGTAAVKIVEMSREGNFFKLLNYGQYELLPGADTTSEKTGLRLPGRWLSDEDVITGIQTILKKSGIKSRDAVVAIPSFPTFSTIIAMPFLSEEELNRSVPFEARKYIPVPLNEVRLKWQAVGVKEVINAGVKSQLVEVYILAVPIEEINRYTSIMQKSGLNLIEPELESIALTRALIGNDRSPTVIINFGGRGTSILVVDGGFQRVGRDFEVGGYSITRAIAKSLGISSERADGMKKTMGILAEDQNNIRPAIISLVDLMVLETKKTIHSFEDTRGAKVANVILVGGMANMPGLLDYFREKLDRPVSAGNTLARVIVPSQLEPLKQELSNAFAVAVGLSMKEIK